MNEIEEHRPWGYYRILADEPDHKVKKIVVYPNGRLSLQRHRRRSEHWFFIQGKGFVTLNEERIEVQSGQSVDIPQEAWHRVEGTGEVDLIFIEVQTGSYFGEDDIERTEDDYGRI
jgi:mannose-6-phosphate isomerase